MEKYQLLFSIKKKKNVYIRGLIMILLTTATFSVDISTHLQYFH